MSDLTISPYNIYPQLPIPTNTDIKTQVDKAIERAEKPNTTMDAVDIMQSKASEDTNKPNTIMDAIDIMQGAQKIPIGSLVDIRV